MAILIWLLLIILDLVINPSVVYENDSGVLKLDLAEVLDGRRLNHGTHIAQHGVIMTTMAISIWHLPTASDRRGCMRMRLGRFK